MLKFDESTHTYRWKGVKVPGVTSILADFIKVEISGVKYHVNRNTGQVISSSVMEEAAAKGKDIHLGSQLIAQGGIDWDALDGMYTGPLRQFEKWLEDYNPQILFTEAPFYSERYGYAGTIDLIANVPRIGKALCFIDIKTGGCDSVGPQTSAYEAGWCEHNKYKAGTQRWVLKIPKNGDPYKFERLTGKQDFDYFKSCLFIHNFLNGGK